MGIFYRCIYDAATQLWWISLGNREINEHQIYLENIEQDITNTLSLLTAIKMAPNSEDFKSVSEIEAAWQTTKDIKKQSKEKFLKATNRSFEKIKNKLEEIKGLDSEVTDDLYVDLTRAFHDASGYVHSSLMVNINSILGKPAVSQENLYQMATFFYIQALEIVKLQN